MQKPIVSRCFLLCIAAAWIPFSVAMPPQAQPQHKQKLLGGPRGVVRTKDGLALEGIMVQLISQKSAMRTTVYSDGQGNFEYPKLENGRLHASD
jgi:hypothetical protein